MKKIVIAIDGNVGSGKSTLAKALAKNLNINFFNTGAIYRALACEFLKSGYKKSDINQKLIDDFVKKTNVKVDYSSGEKYIVNGTDYSSSLRTEEISNLSAIIAPYESIQNFVKSIQREFAKKHSCVMEGRDVGFDVLPNADYKFFLTADEKVRAKRRFDDLVKKDKNTAFEDVLKDLQNRDYADIHRKVAPLKMASDAILIDNTNMDLDKTLEFCLNIINKKHKSQK